MSRFWRARRRDAVVLSLGAAQLGCVIPLSTTNPDGGPVGNGDGGPSSGDGSIPDGSSGGDTGIVPGSWTVVTANLSGLDSGCGNLGYMAANPNQDMLIAGVALDGLWDEVDAGTDWTALGQVDDAGAPAVQNRTSAIVFDPSHPGTFWESGAYGPCAYETTDNGATFTQLGSAQLCDLISPDFSDSMRQTILAGGHEIPSLFRSADGGKTWVDIGPNVPAMTAGTPGFPLTLSKTVHLVGTYQGTASGIYRSIDSGMTWSLVNPGAVRSPPLVTSDGTIYWLLDNTSTTSPGMVKSTDNGATWSSIAGSANLLHSTPQVGISQLADGRFIATTPTSLVISSDQGATWSAVTPPFPPSFGPDGFLYSPFRKAFFISYWTCNSGANPVPPDAIMTFPFDATAQ